MIKKKTLKDIAITGKKVLVRVDFNVPIQDGNVGDDTRIRAALPTIQYLLDHQAAVILTSHLGRPAGEPDPALSLEPVAEYLKTLVDAPVKFAGDCIGKIARDAAQELKTGEILLLENTRFHVGEKNNDPDMARQLAALADVFVNDAFGTAHRAHASNVGVTEFLPSAAGFLMEKEIQYLGNALANPERPFVAILGGAKVSGKIDVIHELLSKTDSVLIGGGMANTFFAAQGLDMADSLVEQDAIEIAREILGEGEGKLELPVDFVIADAFDNQANHKTMPVGDVPAGWRVLDIGLETVAHYAEIIQKAGMITWNGPMGVFEMSTFAVGTTRLAEAIAESDAVSIIGGGDSAAAVQQSGVAEKITHISTGGGASLEMMEGAVLPGLEALDDLE